MLQLPRQHESFVTVGGWMLVIYSICCRTHRLRDVVDVRKALADLRHRRGIALADPRQGEQQKVQRYPQHLDFRPVATLHRRGEARIHANVLRGSSPVHLPLIFLHVVGVAQLIRCSPYLGAIHPAGR